MRILVSTLLLAFTLAASASESIITLNVDPSKEYPRNSEGSFVTLKSGRIMFCYSQFYGGTGDESPARIVRINSDGSIPNDNPFFNTATGANRSIWALGLRNPFTFAFQPGPITPTRKCFRKSRAWILVFFPCSTLKTRAFAGL